MDRNPRHDRYRRALYTFRRRSTPYPMLTNFDAPNGDSACVRRTRSNTPLPASTTMNEVVFLEAARALGKRMILEAGSNDADRIRFGFRLCTSRSHRQRIETARNSSSATTIPLCRWLAQPGRGDLRYEGTERQSTRRSDPNAMGQLYFAGPCVLNLDETITRE